MTSSTGFIGELDSSFHSPTRSVNIAELTNNVGLALVNDATFVHEIARSVATKLIASDEFARRLNNGLLASGLLKDCVQHSQLESFTASLLRSKEFLGAVGAAVDENNGIAYDDSGARVEPSQVKPVPLVYVLVNEQPADEWIKVAADHVLQSVGYAGPQHIVVDSADQLVGLQSGVNAAPAVLLYMVNCSTERLDAFVKFDKLDRAMTAPRLVATVVIGVRSMNQRAKMEPIVSDVDRNEPTVAGRAIPYGTCFFFSRTRELFAYESRSALDAVRHYAVPPPPPKRKERPGIFNSMKGWFH
jgi:hypothetical protein